MKGNRLKAAPLTWRKVQGSLFYEIANPVRFLSISVKAVLEHGKRGPVVAGAEWSVTAWAANENEKIVLACGRAGDMRDAKRLGQSWWNRTVRSLRGSVAVIDEGDRTMSNRTLYWQFDGKGCWQAESLRAPEHFEQGAMWTIAVCDDGTFTVNETDEILLTLKRHDACFPTLVEAMAWCQTQEGQM